MRIISILIFKSQSMLKGYHVYLGDLAIYTFISTVRYMDWLWNFKPTMFQMMLRKQRKLQSLKRDNVILKATLRNSMSTSKKSLVNNNQRYITITCNSNIRDSEHQYTKLNECVLHISTMVYSSEGCYTYKSWPQMIWHSCLSNSNLTSN